MDHSERATLCKDGKYRWLYEMSLYTNPTILMLIMKIMGWITVGIWGFLLIIELFDGPSWESVWSITVTFFYMMLLMMALCVVGYLAYALFVGGKYVVLFEMDENGVMHKQMPPGVKKAKLIGRITALAGAATGKPGMVSSGLRVAARTQMYSDFKAVRSVESFPSRHLIKVNAPLNYNQVYVGKEDYDFVLNYIKSHINDTVTTTKQKLKQ